MNAARSASARFLSALHDLAGNGHDTPLRGGRLCEICVQVLPISGATIAAAMPDGGWDVLGSVGPAAGWLADAEIATGEGPGPDCHRDGAPVRVTNPAATLASGRWPLLAQWDRMPTLGAVCSIPLQLGAIRVGFLDLLDAEQVLRNPATYADALKIADVITTALLSALTPPAPPVDDAAVGPWWEPTVSTREIHQATGMVAVQLDTSAAVAYARVIGHAFTTGRRLDEIAGEVVARRLRFRPEPDGRDRDPEPGPAPQPKPER